MREPIPFVRPHISDDERAAVLAVLDSASLGGNGRVGAELEERLEELLDARHVLLTTSCSHAMELAAMVLGFTPGDEVIMPSFTFVTTASSVVREGATPVFVDIDEATFNLDPKLIEARITPRTRAIVPVHYAGHACAMDEIMAIARRHGLAVIEDAAQGLGASYGGRALGTLGDIGCLSFHTTKNIVGGEGGAFITNDDELAAQAEIVREKGTNRAKFLRGEVDKYTWVAVGSSFVPSDVLSAIVLAQLGKLEEIQERRRMLWERYQQLLQPLAERGDLILPVVEPRAQPNWHIYAIRVTDAERRDSLLNELRRRGIGATFHFVPLHSSPYAQERWGYCEGELPVTERVAESLVRLPLFPGLSDDDHGYVIGAIYDCFRPQLARRHSFHVRPSPPALAAGK